MFDNSLSSQMVKKLLGHLIFGKNGKVFNFNVGCHIQFLRIFLISSTICCFEYVLEAPKHQLLTQNSYLGLCVSFQKKFNKYDFVSFLHIGHC